VVCWPAGEDRKGFVAVGQDGREEKNEEGEGEGEGEGEEEGEKRDIVLASFGEKEDDGEKLFSTQFAAMAEEFIDTLQFC
jgi:hypothetical protein